MYGYCGKTLFLIRFIIRDGSAQHVAIYIAGIATDDRRLNVDTRTIRIGRGISRFDTTPCIRNETREKTRGRKTSAPCVRRGPAYGCACPKQYHKTSITPNEGEGTRRWPARDRRACVVPAFSVRAERNVVNNTFPGTGGDVVINYIRNSVDTNGNTITGPRSAERRARNRLAPRCK